MTTCLVMEFENVYYPNTYLPAKFLTSTPLDIKKASKKFARKNPWGNRSYADLIAQAISSSPEQRLTLSQIYEWMTKNIPFFQNQLDSSSSAGWKNSIRHNLSLHKKFRRIRNDATGKSSWWTVNPEVGTVRSPRRKGSSRRKRTKGMENMSLFKNHHPCKLPNFPIWSTPSSNVSPPPFDLPLTERNHSVFSPTQVYQESQTSFRGCLQEQYRQDSKTMTDYFMSPHHLSGSYITIGEDKERSNFCHEIETDVGILSVFAHGKDEKGSEENAVRENDSEDDVIDLLLNTDIADIERLDMVLKEIRSIQNEYEIATNQNLQDSNRNVSDDIVASSMLDSDNQSTVDESDVHQLSSCSTSNLLPNASLLQTTNISQKNLSENFALQPLMAMERPVSYSEPILFSENFCMSDSNQKLKEKILRKKKLSSADNSKGQLYHSKSWQNESENKYNSEESNKIASFQNTFYSNYQFSDTTYRTSVNLTNFNETFTKRLVNNTTYRKTVSQNISQIYEQNITQATYPNSIPTPDHILGISKHELSQTYGNEKEGRYFPFLFEYNSNPHKIYPNSDLNFLNNCNISEERVNTCIYKQEIEQVAQSNTFLDAEACTLPTSRKDCCYNLPETLNIVDSAHPDSSNMDTTIQKDVLVELNDCEIKSENDDCFMKENLELSSENINKVSGIDTQYVEGDDQNKCLLNYNQNTELLSFSNPFLPALTIQEKKALADPQITNFSSAFELHHPSQLSSIDDALEEMFNMNSSYAKDSIESAVLEMAKELLGKDMSSSLEGKSEDTDIYIDEDTDIYLWNEVLGSDSITIQENSQGSVTNEDCKDEKFAAKCDFTKNIFQGSNQNIS